MQANGAEMLRLAVCLGIENGIKIVAPIHDALMIEASINRLEADIERMRSYMVEASRVVLDGFELRVEVNPPIYWPDHYSDERGTVMRETIMGL